MLVFIDRNSQKPEPKEGDDLCELKMWEMVNSMIWLYILNLIELKLRNSISFVETIELCGIT